MPGKTAVMLGWLAFAGWVSTNAATSDTSAVSEGALSGVAHPPALTPAQQAEQIRTACIEGRRFICGRVLEVTPTGLIVDSGYEQLLSPPFNHSWVVRGTA